MSPVRSILPAPVMRDGIRLAQAAQAVLSAAERLSERAAQEHGVPPRVERQAEDVLATAAVLSVQVSDLAAALASLAEGER